MAFLRKRLAGFAVATAGIVALFWSFREESGSREFESVCVSGEKREAELSLHGDSDLPLSVFPDGAVRGEVILFFETLSAREAFLSRLKKRGVAALGLIPEINAVRITEKTLAAFPDIVGVTSADFNFSVRVPSVESGETLPPELREGGAGGNAPVGNSALALMNASAEACAASAAGNGIKIAVLDTGVFTEHVAFEGLKISKIDVAGGAADTPESQAHGTAVASLIFGNGAGEISGLASGAEMLAVRVFDGEGNATAFSLAQGIIAAVESGADIINISAGITADSAVLRAAVEYARSAGATLVAAAGNEGVTALAFPAAYKGVIAVGAVDGNGASAAFSNVGENLAVVAPGVAVYAAGTDTPDGIVDFSGTSAAAPLVAGALAAAISNNTGDFDIRKISDTADDFGVPGRDDEYGAGIVNFERLTRPPGVRVTDISVNDFYLSGGKGAGNELCLVATMQNRGTLWEACTFSLRITFADGSVSVAGGNLNLRPGESVGQATDLSSDNLKTGVYVNAEIRDSGGNILSEKNAFLKKK